MRPKHAQGRLCVAMNERGQRLLVVDSLGRAELWVLTNLAVGECEMQSRYQLSIGPVCGIQSSWKDTVVICADDAWELVEPSTGNVLYGRRGRPGRLVAADRYLVQWFENKALFTDLEAARLAASFVGRSGTVGDVAFSRNRIAVLTDGYGIHRVDLSSGQFQVVARDRDCGQVVVDAAGKHVFTAANQGSAISVRDLPQGRLLSKQDVPAAVSQSISPDGCLALWASRSGRLDCFFVLMSSQDGWPHVATLQTGLPAPATKFHFAPDNRSIYAVKGTVFHWWGLETAIQAHWEFEGYTGHSFGDAGNVLAVAAAGEIMVYRMN